jgi:hypothetical protein
MQAVKVETLSQYKSKAKTESPVQKSANAEFPEFGKTDFDVFENNLLEVMQFVFNHTTFDANNDLDQKLLAVYAPLGVVPGQTFDPPRSPKSTALFSVRLRKASRRKSSRRQPIPSSRRQVCSNSSNPRER